jgi:parallel beta-helix repeat protein
LISGNADDGVYISDVGTSRNQVSGNIIGPNWQGNGVIGQGANGVVIALGASSNAIGDGTEAGRNLISGNSFDGVRITGSDTMSNTVQGNYIGTNVSGTAALPNGLHGVELTHAAHGNLVGGDRFSGQGNLLSGNGNHGLLIIHGAHHNTALGNLIGPDATGTHSLGNHPFGGIDIADGAHHNVIGGLDAGDGNLISGNQVDGIALFTTEEHTGDATADNRVLGNLIGLTLDGSSALPNRGPGIFNVSGAVRTWIEGNTVSGNLTCGVRLSGGTAVSGTLVANRIGTDLTGTLPIPNGEYGVWISEGAHGHLLEDNTISGNTLGGVMIRDGGGTAPQRNVLRDNRIGTDIDGKLSVSNGGPGVGISESARNNTVGSNNTIAFNRSCGIVVEACHGNTITENSIHSNALASIESDCVRAPQITDVAIGSTETVTGTTIPNARVEFFSDDDDQGRVYEGFTIADAAGDFFYSKVVGFAGPNLTATSTDGAGNTSEFSEPAHLLWTMLLYLNGDNNLDEFIFNAVTNTVAAGPSPRANVLALVDGCTTTMAHSGTVLYDLTRGEPRALEAADVSTGERNMGDWETLMDFVTWGRSHYPARHTMLAIFDHGGGWAPSGGATIPGALPHRNSWLAGNSGLSWDFSSDFDYLDSKEIRQAMARIAKSRAGPLDVVFYDVCLMGMLEVAYQIKDYASFFVSSQNIAWAPLGPEGRYIQTIHGLQPTATPRQMAELLVHSYANATPPEQHPFTISAVDLASLSTVADAASGLAVAISQTLTDREHAVNLYAAYSEAQKIDYDSDFRIEPDTDGFVDLYDFALRVPQHFADPEVVAAAQALTAALDVAIVAEAHRSGAPWVAADRVWDLDNVHGLSVFLPLGEDLELPIVITETSVITPSLVISRNLRLRDLYSSDQLQFVADTAWRALVETYYTIVSSPVPTNTTEGPIDGPQIPDVTPPQTVVTLISTGPFAVGEAVTVTWVATDTQTGAAGARLWHRPPWGEWKAGATQEGSSGAFSFTLSEECMNGFAVRAFDAAGNIEPRDSGSNTVHVNVEGCIYLPLILRFPP